MTDMPRCRTCKWWEPATQQSGVCALTKYDGIAALFAMEGPDSLAWAMPDTPDGAAHLETLPDFGCVQHEPREDEP